MNSQQCALVTGATGFTGRHLVRRLLGDGWNVHAITRSSQRPSSPVDASSGTLTVHRLLDPPRQSRAIVEQVGPNVVFHLAAAGGYDHAAEDVDRLIDVNVLFGTQMLEGLRSLGGGCIVWTASSWQHYEGKSYSPVALYAATKQAFADIVAYYRETTTVRAVALELSDTYGPEDHRNKLFSQLIAAVDSGIPVKLSPGGQIVDYSHIDDVCAAIAHAADYLLDGGEGGTFSVSSGERYTVRDLVERLSQAIGRDIPVNFGGRRYRPREMMFPWEGEPLPGWSACIGLDVGLRKVYGGSSPPNSSPRISL